MSLSQTISGQVSPSVITGLAERLTGTCHLPGDAAFDSCCAIWNGMIDKRPAVVVRPANEADIATTTTFAKDNSLPLSVRGGGHNVAGAALSNRGVTIDMSQRRTVTVDPQTMLVRVDAGATWKDVDAATQPHGIVVPTGIISATGVAGLALGGGFGWTSRRFGFTADNIASARVVTADGKVRTASATENPDLYWALRGGGGNFAVVTEFTFRGHRHGPEVMAGMVVHPFKAAREVIEFYVQLTTAAPDELTCLLVLRRAPPAPWIPEAYHGQLIAGIAAHWTGSIDEGATAMKSLKDFGKPIADTIEPKSFVSFQSFLDGGQPFGRRYYWKSDEAAEFGGELETELCRAAEAIDSPFSALLCMQMGGAPARIPVGDTAVGIRGAQYGLVFQAAWTQPSEDAKHIAWARNSAAAVRPFTSGSSYINFINADEEPARLRSAYPDETFRRLRQVKAIYDPQNMFGGSLSIPPAG
ncbi:MAG: FAD-binding oxidoreductase [Pseudorhizobium sp.]